MKQSSVSAAKLISFVVVIFSLSLATAQDPSSQDPSSQDPSSQDPSSQAIRPLAGEVKAMIKSYCLDCHNRGDRTAGLDLEAIHTESVADDLTTWEQVLRKLRARQMPPLDADRPAERMIVEVVKSLEQSLDQFASDHPRPGRTETFRRLTRFEYGNAIRDLLSLQVDVASLLPADQASHGFDNTAVADLSPALVSRYLSAAQQISQLAIGRSLQSPISKTIRIRPDVTQEEHVEGLPIGTRGGVLIPYTVPQDGEYEVRVRLARDRNEQVEGLSEPHELELLADLRRVKLFTVTPPKRDGNLSDPYSASTQQDVDRHLAARLMMTAGPHQIGVTFIKNSSSLLETKRQPLNVHFNMYRHPRIGPAVYQVTITGPLPTSGPAQPKSVPPIAAEPNPESPEEVPESPSRRRIFVCRPSAPEDEVECARRIIATLLRRACRQKIEAEDLEIPMASYRRLREQGDFEEGIEMALSSVLVNPKFLLKIERDPQGLPPGTAYRITDFELASRLSFFLWSSIPDDQLLDLAERGQLSDPTVLQQQTKRMLLDDRADALVSNFAGQWLYLRNLESITPDARLYPDFDDNLRQSLRRETELFFQSILREDRSVLELLKTDYTYLNERLAKHYGIPHVYGSRFRRVSLDDDSHRGGLLRQGSLLTVTSYATRTSPVIRGKWILENMLGTPPPPPPPNIPALEDNRVSATLPVRERLALHRADPTCASCHDLIDPIGFSLENFDAVGRWREFDGGQPLDATAGLPDGSRFSGVDGLEQGLLSRPEIWVGTMTEKLLSYAIGRDYQPFDAPAIRKIVRQAEVADYRFSALIFGIVKSTPFQMRTSK